MSKQHLITRPSTEAAKAMLANAYPCASVGSDAQRWTLALAKGAVR